MEREPEPDFPFSFKLILAFYFAALVVMFVMSVIVIAHISGR